MYDCAATSFSAALHHNKMIHKIENWQCIYTFHGFVMDFKAKIENKFYFKIYLKQIE